jgi:hypothetical protein
MGNEILKKDFVSKYQLMGEDKFYRFLLAYAISKLASIKNKTYDKVYPDIEFMEYYERFMILFRKEGKEVYLHIGKCFRKASHRIYRLMLRQKLTDRNTKFLNLV